ncbi:MAG: hypothetical protein JNM66_28965 [Bryobacterales bacterium]|nr:hypothetical protein [Bryobacterales bacterium]
MSSPAQVLANQANSRHSTGPKTVEGKAKSSRNNLRHGLSLGVLVLDEAARARFCEFEAKMRAELKPEGFMECEAFQQFIDAAARLDKVRDLLAAIYAKCCDDPLVVPETEAEMAQLIRYRAAAEMAIYRSVRILRELQTTRLFRLFHVTPEEQLVIPPLVRPGLKMFVDGALYGHNDRELFYNIHGAETFCLRLPWLPPGPPAFDQFASSNPIAA